MDEKIAEMEKLKTRLEVASVCVPDEVQFIEPGKLNDWLPNENGTLLTLYLRSEVVDILQTPMEQGVYDHLREHLDMRIGQTLLGHVVHSHSKGRRQKPNESAGLRSRTTAPEILMKRLAVEALSGGPGDGESRQAVQILQWMQ